MAWVAPGRQSPDAHGRGATGKDCSGPNEPRTSDHSALMGGGRKHATRLPPGAPKTAWTLVTIVGNGPRSRRCARCRLEGAGERWLASVRTGHPALRNTAFRQI